jgi:hypothetical protein
MASETLWTQQYRQELRWTGWNQVYPSKNAFTIAVIAGGTAYECRLEWIIDPNGSRWYKIRPAPEDFTADPQPRGEPLDDDSIDLSQPIERWI